MHSWYSLLFIWRSTKIKFFNCFSTWASSETLKAGVNAWEYDTEFRTRQALKLAPWNKIYSDLWLKLMTNTNKIETQASQIRIGFPGQSNQSRPTRRICFGFNKGRCYLKNCRYSHIYLACKGDHAEKQVSSQYHFTEHTYRTKIQKIQIPMHSPTTGSQGLFVAHSGDSRFELSLTPVDLSMFDKQLEEYSNREAAEELKNDFK